MRKEVGVVNSVLAEAVVMLAAVVVMASCRRPETHALVSGSAIPSLRTRVLEQHAVNNHPPATAPGLVIAPPLAPRGRRAGGVPESIVVSEDCGVRATWWATHLCGTVATGAASWLPERAMAVATLTLDGAARTDCPSQVTRFETIIEGLADGAYRFGTERKYVEFHIRCGSGR